MRSLLVACAALIVGLLVGISLREKPATITQYVYRDTPVVARPKATSAGLEFPAMPKPPVEKPTPASTRSGSEGTSIASPPDALVSDLPRLPSAGGPSGPFMDAGPISPPAPSELPAADLKADEALARRVVLSAGGEIVSSSDAKDTSGKIGRALVAEAPPGRRASIESALRRSLGDRVILSDGGTVGAVTPEARKAEDALLALRKQRDQARIDFLPNAPALIDIEEAYRQQERSVDGLRKASGRQRFNLLIRPVLGT